MWSDIVRQLGPHSSRRADIAPGRTTRVDLAGRSVWIHKPDVAPPDDGFACVVFQDGAGFLDPEDDMRAGRVLDNLVAAGEVPPTVGVFMDPGPDRNAEYDTFDASYADLVAEEVLPLVGRRVHLAEDRSHRILCGFSSGGNASLTAAWHRPDVFGAAVGFSSSFAQIPGGNPFPRLLATEPHRHLRVYLLVGRRDLGWDEPQDNWVAENLRTAAALHEASYDVRLELGDGGHDSHDAGVLLPDALRWVLRE